MLQTLSKKITQKLLHEGSIDEEDIEVYEYGLYILFMQMISTGTIFIIGILIGKLELTIVFILVLYNLRQYTGGYHSDSYIGCYLISCLTYMGVILLADGYVGLDLPYVLIITGISTTVIFMIGSVNSDKNPKTTLEMKYRVKRIRITLAINTLLIMMCTYFRIGSPKIGLIIMWSQVVVMFSLLIVKFKRRKIL